MSAAESTVLALAGSGAGSARAHALEPDWIAVAARPRRAPARSLVAAANALLRMKESSRPAGERILHDPFAAALAGKNPILQVLRFARFLVPALHRAIDQLQTAHCVRHRAIDELVLRAVKRDGFEQVVVVGAGYDMRPSRFAGELGQAAWFELDLPLIGARKQALVGALRGANPRVHYGAVDLARQPLRAGLAATAFDPARPTCFVLEGLVHYLPRARFDALLAEIGAGPARRRAILSFIRPDVYNAAPAPLRTLIRVVREVPRLQFGWTQLADACAAHGLERFRAWTYADQVTAFAPVARGRRVGSAQDVAEVEHS